MASIAAQVSDFKSQITAVRVQRQSLVKLRKELISNIDTLTQKLKDMGPDDDIELLLADLGEKHKENLEQDQDLQYKEDQLTQGYIELALAYPEQVPSKDMLLSEIFDVDEVLPEIDASVLVMLLEVEIRNPLALERIQKVVDEKNQFVVSPEVADQLAKGIDPDLAAQNDLELRGAISQSNFWKYAGIATVLYMIFG